MSVLRLPARRVLFASFAFIALASCAKKLPIEGLRVDAASAARKHLLLSTTVAAPKKLFARVDDVSARAGLPFRGADLKTFLAAQLAIPVEAFSALDDEASIGIATLSRGKDDVPFTVMSLVASSSLAADKLAEGAGPVVERREKAEKRQRAKGGALWILRNGARLYIGDRVEDLIAGAALADEARTRALQADSLRSTVYPAAIATWQNTDVRRGLLSLKQKLLDEEDAEARKRGRRSSLAQRASQEASLDSGIDLVADSDDITAALELDPSSGLRLGARLRPRAGTALHKKIATPTPYEFDPRVLAGESGSVAVVTAVGKNSTWFRERVQHLLDVQARAGVVGAADVARLFRTFVSSYDGSQSVAMRLGQGSFALAGTLGVSSGAAATNAAEALLSAPSFDALMRASYGPSAPAVQVMREGQRLKIATTVPETDDRGVPLGQILRQMFGSSRFELVVAPAEGRLLLASEPNASRQLLNLAAAASTAPTPPPDLAAALAATRGQDSFMYFDLWTIAQPVLGVAVRGPQGALLRTLLGLPGFAKLSLPVYASSMGGNQLTIDLQVPLTTLSNAGTVVKMVTGLGAMGRPPATP